MHVPVKTRRKKTNPVVRVFEAGPPGLFGSRTRLRRRKMVCDKQRPLSGIYPKRYESPPGNAIHQGII